MEFFTRALVFLALIFSCALPLTVARAHDSGCGLGSMIIQEDTRLMQILAATTNATFFTQTFGISSGTSNCTSQNFVMNEKAVQYFAEVNHDDLSREMAQGEGEKLLTLASLFGCTGPMADRFARFVRSSYERILPQPRTPPTEMVRNLTREVSAAGLCSIEI